MAEQIDLKTALGRENTLVIAANRQATTLLERAKKGEKPIPPPPELEAALCGVLGCKSDDLPDKCKARVAGKVVEGHIRKGDVIVIATEAGGPGTGYTLRGPIVIDGEMWDKEAKGGAGHVRTGPFFEAVSALSRPMFPQRRAEPENGYFELRHA